VSKNTSRMKKISVPIYMSCSIRVDWFTQIKMKKFPKINWMRT